MVDVLEDEWCVVRMENSHHRSLRNSPGNGFQSPAWNTKTPIPIGDYFKHPQLADRRIREGSMHAPVCHNDRSGDRTPIHIDNPASDRRTVEDDLKPDDEDCKDYKTPLMPL